MPWAGQLWFSMLASAHYELGRSSFIPKSLDEKRRNSLFSELFYCQYIATDWVIGKILEYWFLGLSPSSFPLAVLSVRGTMSDVAEAPRCVRSRDTGLLRTPFACPGHARVSAEPQGPHRTPFPHFAAVLGVFAEMTSLRTLSNTSLRAGRSEIRLETAACGRLRLQRYGKMMSCSALTAVIAPYYLHCNTARGHLSSSNAQQQNPCPKVFPSVSFNLNKGLCFQIIIIQLNVFLASCGCGEVEMPLLSVACFACLCVPRFAALPEVLTELVGALRTQALCPWLPVSPAGSGLEL